MMFKYRISTRDGEEKVVIGATQAREAIKDLLTIHDIVTLLVVKEVREMMQGRIPVIALTKSVADWVVNNLYPQRIDFDNFSIEVVEVIAYPNKNKENNYGKEEC